MEVKRKENKMIKITKTLIKEIVNLDSLTYQDVEVLKTYITDVCQRRLEFTELEWKALKLINYYEVIL